jgi:hypothetical protein
MEGYKFKELELENEKKKVLLKKNIFSKSMKNFRFKS